MESQVQFQTALKCCVECCGLWRAGPDPQHLGCSLSPSFHTQIHPSSRGAVTCSSVDTPVVWCVSCVYNYNPPSLPTPLQIVTLSSKDAGDLFLRHCLPLEDRLGKKTNWPCKHVPGCLGMEFRCPEHPEVGCDVGSNRGSQFPWSLVILAFPS